MGYTLEAPDKLLQNLSPRLGSHVCFRALPCMSPRSAGKFVFSVKDTMQCLEMGAVEILIVWENLDCDRYELMNPSTQKVEVKLLNAEQVRSGGCRKRARRSGGEEQDPGRARGLGRSGGVMWRGR